MNHGNITGHGKARILIVDDHPIVCEGMAQFLNLQENLHLCCQAANADEALAAMSACNHAVAIVDISLDGDTGLDLIKTLRRRYPDLAILTLSMHDESLFAERALRSGANGYLMKQEGTKSILQAVQQVLAGRVYLSAAMQNTLTQRLDAPQDDDHSLISGLSAREFEVLHLIGLGFGTRQIAEKLNRSVKTIEAHRANLKEKLQLASGTELLSFAIRWFDNN
ncbi:MAG: two component LuxR family transcriptional regulator [Comamonadaceae bacterium]|nr:MAG: two component LuxR family transcriptional regulator [Comamonadaceae bacterium]